MAFDEVSLDDLAAVSDEEVRQYTAQAPTPAPAAGDVSLDDLDAVSDEEVQQLSAAPEAAQQAPDPDALIGKYAPQYNINPIVIKSTLGQESGGDSGAVSPKQATGLMQVMPATGRAIAERLGIPYTDELLKDPDFSVNVGAYLLDEGMRRYGDDPRFASIYYHAGNAGGKTDRVRDEFLRTGELKVPRTRVFWDGSDADWAAGRYDRGKFTDDYFREVADRAVKLQEAGWTPGGAQETTQRTQEPQMPVPEQPASPEGFTKVETVPNEQKDPGWLESIGGALSTGVTNLGRTITAQQKRYAEGTEKPWIQLGNKEKAKERWGKADAALEDFVKNSDAAKAVEAATKATLDKDGNFVFNKDTPKAALATITQSLPQILPAMLPGVGTALSAGASVGTQKNEFYDAAVDNGFTKEQAAKYAGEASTLAGSLDFIGTLGMVGLKRIPGAKGVTNAVGSGALKMLPPAVRGALLNGVVKFAGKTAGAAGIEGLTEFNQSTIQNYYLGRLAAEDAAAKGMSEYEIAQMVQQKFAGKPMLQSPDFWLGALAGGGTKVGVMGIDAGAAKLKSGKAAESPDAQEAGKIADNIEGDVLLAEQGQAQRQKTDGVDIEEQRVRTPAEEVLQQRQVDKGLAEADMDAAQNQADADVAEGRQKMRQNLADQQTWEEQDKAKTFTNKDLVERAAEYARRNVLPPEPAKDQKPALADKLEGKESEQKPVADLATQDEEQNAADSAKKLLTDMGYTVAPPDAKPALEQKIDQNTETQKNALPSAAQKAVDGPTALEQKLEGEKPQEPAPKVEPAPTPVDPNAELKAKIKAVYPDKKLSVKTAMKKFDIKTAKQAKVLINEIYNPTTPVSTTGQLNPQAKEGEPRSEEKGPQGKTLLSNQTEPNAQVPGVQPAPVSTDLSFEDYDRLPPDQKKKHFEDQRRLLEENPVTNRPGQRHHDRVFRQRTENGKKTVVVAVGDVNGFKKYNDELLGMRGTDLLNAAMYDTYSARVGEPSSNPHGDEHFIVGRAVDPNNPADVQAAVDDLRARLQEAMEEVANKNQGVGKNGQKFRPTMSWSIGLAKNEAEFGEINPKGAGKNVITIDKSTGMKYNISKGAQSVTDEEIITRGEKNGEQQVTPAGSDAAGSQGRNAAAGRVDNDRQSAADRTDKSERKSDVPGGTDQPTDAEVKAESEPAAQKASEPKPAAKPADKPAEKVGEAKPAPAAQQTKVVGPTSPVEKSDRVKVGKLKANLKKKKKAEPEGGKVVAQREDVPAADGKYTADQVRSWFTPQDSNKKTPVKVIANESEMTEKQKARAVRDQAVGKIKAFFDMDTGEVVVIANKVRSRADAEKSAIHELFHKGARSLHDYVNGTPKAAKLDSIYKQIYKSLPQAEKDQIGRLYGRPDVFTLVDEVLANRATYSPDPTLVQKAIALIRKILRDAGFNMKWSDSDILNFISEARSRGLKDTTKSAGEGAAYQIDPKNENFKRWFGNSKIVDENGDPLVVYRGDAHSRPTTFKATMRREPGLFTTPDKETAAIYGNGREPQALYVKAEKVLDLTQDNSFARKWVSEWAGKYDEWVDRATGESVDPFNYLQSGQLFDYEGDWSSNRWRNIQLSAESDGYDAVWLPDDGFGKVVKSLVVFNGKNVKSATENTGDFSAESDDVRYQLSDMDADDASTLTEIGTELRKDHGDDFEAWRKDMQDEIGNEYDEHLDDVWDAIGGKLPKYAGNINLERINAEFSVKDLINEIAEQFSKQMNFARRGVRPHEVTAESARDLGMTEAQLLKRRRGSNWNAEHILAAREIQVASAKRFLAVRDKLAQKRANGGLTDADLVEFKLEQAKHAAIQAEVAGISAEAGRALNIFNRAVEGQAKVKSAKALLEELGGREVNERILDKLLSMDPENLPAINRFVQKSIWARTSDAVYEAWLAGMLSSFPTHTGNALSNTASILYRTFLERPVAGTADAILSKFQNRPRERFVHEATEEMAGMIGGLADAWDAMKYAWKTEGSLFGEGRLGNEAQHAIPGKAGDIIRTPLRALAAADEFFKVLVYRGTLHTMAYRKARAKGLEGKEFDDFMEQTVNNPTELMREKAINEAQYRTFTKPLGPIGQWIMSGRQLPFLGPILKVVMPFVKTPTNIAKYALERLPISSQAILAKKVISGDIKDAEIADELAKGMVGSMLALIAVGIAQSGAITGGGPEDKGERTTLYNAGWLPYSIKIGDRYYSYIRMEPLSSVIGMAADFAEMKMEDYEDDKLEAMAAKMAMSFGKNILNKTFMAGLNDAQKAISDPTRYGEKWVKRMAGSLIPAVVAAGARATDDELKDAQTIGETLRSRVPALSETVPAKRDIWGRAIERSKEEGAGDFMSAIETFFSPVRTSKETDDPIDQEMARIKLNLTPPKPEITVNRQTVELNDEEYAQYQEMLGQAAYKAVGQALRSGEYRRLPDEDKADHITSVINKARRGAKENFINRLQLGRGAASKADLTKPLPRAEAPVKREEVYANAATKEYIKEQETPAPKNGQAADEFAGLIRDLRDRMPKGESKPESKSVRQPAQTFASAREARRAGKQAGDKVRIKGVGIVELA